MFKNPEIREFFNDQAQGGAINHALAKRQLRLMSALEVVANQALAGHGRVTTSITGVHKVRDFELPVTSFSFPNGATLTVMDRGEGKNCIVAVRSNAGPVEEKLVANLAYSMTQPVCKEALTGMPTGNHAAYKNNPRCFTFITDEQSHLGSFVAQFAIQQRHGPAVSVVSTVVDTQKPALIAM